MTPKSQIYFGRNVFKEALAAGASISNLYLETKSAYEFVQGIPEFKKIKPTIEEGIPKGLHTEAHQGVAFRSHFEFYTNYSADLLRHYSFIVLCNHVEDIHNLGSIARCAAAFGAKLIIHEDSRSARVTPTMVKHSAGCAFRTKFMRVPDLAAVISSLKKRNYQVVGLDLSEPSTSLYEWKPRLPVALVVGSEGCGIEASVKSACDLLIRIPMENRVDSLNVSHAAGLAMSWLRHICRASHK